MMPEGEWNNFSHEIYSSSSLDEEANFMALLLGNSSSLPSDQCWPIQQSRKVNNETSIYSSSSDEHNHFYSQGSSSNGFINGSFPSNPYSYSSFLTAENGTNSMDYCCGFECKSPEINMMETHGYDFLLLNQDLCIDDGIMDPNDEINHNDDHGINLHLRTGHDEKMIHINNNDQSQSSGGEKASSPSSNIAKKRPRVPIYNVEEDKRSIRQKKNQKVASSIKGHEDEEEDDDDKISNRLFKRQNSMISCYSPDEYDSIAPSSSKSSSKRGGAMPNLKEKTRANRGSSTDPQSIYARKRRERINERLKILQNLVPNGTKVDISTMLEEAVQYVKFLQLQIKLLSSDDLWMYAPIAYNGMDIGLS